jgi:NADP-dependent 3-hydroxy acid dehydrogenase YdfG
VESTNKKHRPEAVVDCAGVSNLQEVANSTVEKWVEEVEVDLVGSYHIARATINENPNTRMVFYASSRSIR